MSHSQKIGQKHSIKIANRSFEDVTKLKYLVTPPTDQNCMHEEIKSRINLGNACYHSDQSLLSSHLLCRNLKVKIYEIIILPVVLYGCETWSLTLMEEHRLRVFENRVLRRIFGLKRDEVTEEWRKLPSRELHNLYSSPDIIRQIKSRRMRLAGHMACMGEGRNVYRVLVGKPKGKRPIGRPRRRWEDGIKMDLREIGWGGGGEVDSFGSGYGSLAGSRECGDGPSASGSMGLVIKQAFDKSKLNSEWGNVIKTSNYHYHLCCSRLVACDEFQTAYKAAGIINLLGSGWQAHCLCSL
jgi:hypothetical protein